MKAKAECLNGDGKWNKNLQSSLPDLVIGYQYLLDHKAYFRPMSSTTFCWWVLRDYKFTLICILSSAKHNKEHNGQLLKIIFISKQNVMKFRLSAISDYLCHCSGGSNFLCSFITLENMSLVINIGPSGEPPNGKVSIVCEWEMHVFPLTKRRALMLDNLQIILKCVSTPKHLPVSKNISSTYW